MYVSNLLIIRIWNYADFYEIKLIDERLENNSTELYVYVF